MRVLVLTQVVVYPADAGPKIKTLEVLRHLAAEHSVCYCTFVRSRQEQEHAEQLGSLCHRVATVRLKRSRISDLRFLCESLITNDAFLLRRDERATMHVQVRRILQEEQIDVLHVDQINMMRFVPPDWSGKVVLDEHNAVWQVIERLRKGAHNPLVRRFLQREVGLMRRLEGEACRRADVVLAVSEQDRQALQEVAGRVVPIEVVPITVDVESLEAVRVARHPQVDRLLTVGTMFWPPNSEGVLWWLRAGYGRVKAQCPDLIYDIVGARPPQELQSVAERCQGVNVHGYVTDIIPFWTQASALLVPLLSGGGVRVKILEAMAIEVPVISTTIGCEGLAVRDGEHLLIADTPEAFADACSRLLRDPELAAQLTLNARRVVLEKYAAKQALQALDVVYRRLQMSKPVVDVLGIGSHP